VRGLDWVNVRQTHLYGGLTDVRVRELRLVAPAGLVELVLRLFDGVFVGVAAARRRRGLMGRLLGTGDVFSLFGFVHAEGRTGTGWDETRVAHKLRA